MDLSIYTLKNRSLFKLFIWSYRTDSRVEMEMPLQEMVSAQQLPRWTLEGGAGSVVTRTRYQSKHVKAEFNEHQPAEKIK